MIGGSVSLLTPLRAADEAPAPALVKLAVAHQTEGAVTDTVSAVVAVCVCWVGMSGVGWFHTHAYSPKMPSLTQ